PCTSPSAGETISISAPAASNASFGPVNSACSNPSATKIATFLPFNAFPMRSSMFAALPDNRGSNKGAARFTKPEQLEHKENVTNPDTVFVLVPYVRGG